MKIGWVGAGKLGLPCALVLDADGHDVIVHDVNERVRNQLLSREGPYQEEGLQQLLDTHVASWGSMEEVVAHSEVVFIAVQTPHAPQFEGVTPLPDERRDFEYAFLVQAFRDVCSWAELLQREVTVVVVSTVLPGTFNRLLRPLVNRYVTPVYNPFFIAMGTTIEDFRNPEFVLVGCDGDAGFKDVQHVYRAVHERPLHLVSIETAELTKVAYNCYSDDTEVMTSEGWRLFADLTGEEEVLSLNPETFKAEWVDHEPVPGQPGHTEMVHFKSAKDDILVTKGHRMLAATLRRGAGHLPTDGENHHYKFGIVAAEDLLHRSSYAFTRKALWDGDAPRHVTVVSHKFPIEVHAEFMGWYLAEGCVTQHSLQSWSVTISQSRRANPDKWAGVRKVVAQVTDILGVGLHEHDGGFVFYHRDMGVFLDRFGNSFGKWVPRIIKDAPTEVVRVFLDAYLAGDGSDGRGTGNLRYYATTSERMASDLGEMIVKVGNMPSYRTTEGMTGRLCHLVYETTSRTSSPKAEVVPYDGLVYCTRLRRNNIMLTRRNGKCSWQGNTFISLKIAFANSMMELCHKTGADVDDLVDGLAMATERVVSAKYLRGGMGDGGGCHPRDNIAMSFLARQHGLSFDIFEMTMRAREEQTRWLAKLIVEYHELTGLPVVILGKSYKADSNLTVGSPATLLIKLLSDDYYDRLRGGVRWVDPVVEPRVQTGVLEGGAVQPQAVVFVATRHEQFRSLKCKQGSVVIDPWGYVEEQEGVTLVKLGRK